MRISERTRGVFVISATPFTEAGDIDRHSIDSLVEFYLSCGVHGITLLGMMGEAQKLTHEEAVGFVRHAVGRVDGRVPVLVGVPTAGLAPLVALSRAAVDAGAAGVLVAPLPGLRTDDQLHRFYVQVCEALGPDIPVVYQDYPQSTAVYLSAPTFLRLVRDLPQLVMLKGEDCPGLGKLTQIREESARTGMRRVSILTGNGGLYFPLELRRGCDGVMTGFAYPDMLVQVYEQFVAGRTAEAEDLFDRYLPLVRYEQQPAYGLAVRKELLRRRGALRCAATRAPGPSLTSADREELDHLQARLGARAGAP